MESRDSVNGDSVNIPTAEKLEDVALVADATKPTVAEKFEEETLVSPKEVQGESLKETESVDPNTNVVKSENGSNPDKTTVEEHGSDDSVSRAMEENGGKSENGNKPDDTTVAAERNSDSVSRALVDNGREDDGEEIQKHLGDEAKAREKDGSDEEKIINEKNQQEAREIRVMEPSKSFSARALDIDLDTQKVVEKAVALKNLVKEKGEQGAVAVSSFIRRLSGKKDDDEGIELVAKTETVGSDSDSGPEGASQKSSVWNPFSYISGEPGNDGAGNGAVGEDPPPHIVTKGRIILYTRLGCRESKEVRAFLHAKRLRYVEINVDVYPGRKVELEKISGSSSVPKLFFNEILIGGLSEVKSLDESGELSAKIDFLVNEAPSFEAPSPPLSGEDDLSNSGVLDETALIVRRLKEFIVPKDRFFKLRWFTSCFLGSEAVDFISENQYLERDEAVEYGRKLASQLFFQHVTGENLFEDGDHLYRFLDDDPYVSKCQNIPRGLIDVKPKPIVEIASRLRFLSYAMFEAYASEDGKHVDYTSIHGSEEFARYLRIVEELQRVEIEDMPREEKLAFFINLYNMMIIHAILLRGHPDGNMKRRSLFNDFWYVIAGSVYSLSDIRNGVLRGNQRPPYTLMKPFSAKDKRSKVALPAPEPLIHFALVSGNESGPALRCYSPGDIDRELKEAASYFLRTGGVIVDLQAKAVSVSKILKWYSVDFGKNCDEVMKYISQYLDPIVAEPLLEFIATSQLKITYQPYDLRLNC